jgi:general secretion pathway protein K
MSTTRRCPHRRRGGALLAVLWLSAALAAIAFSVAATVRGETERTSTAVDGLRSYYLAKGGIHRTSLRLLWSVSNPHLPPAYRPTSRVVDILQFPAGEVRVELIPETSKLNINQAPPEALFRLLVNLGVAPVRAHEITEAILDWRSHRPPDSMSAFDLFYLSRNPSFRSPRASLEEIEELLLLKGMTPDIYYGTWRRAAGEDAAIAPVGGLADCVSVFGSTHGLDANTAHPAVMAAAGLPPDIVAAVVARRNAMPFNDYAELSQFLQGAGAAGARLRVGGQSIWTLRATARLRLSDGSLSDMRRTVAAMVKFMPPGYADPYHILRWYDTAWRPN